MARPSQLDDQPVCAGQVRLPSPLAIPQLATLPTCLCRLHAHAGLNVQTVPPPGYAPGQPIAGSTAALHPAPVPHTCEANKLFATVSVARSLTSCQQPAHRHHATHPQAVPVNPHTLCEPHPGHYPWAPLGVPVISYLVTSPDVSHGPPDEGETRDVGLFVNRPPVRRPALFWV